MATFQTNEILDTIRSQKRNLHDRVQKLVAQPLSPRASKLLAYVVEKEGEGERKLDEMRRNLGSVTSASWIRYFPQELVHEIKQITQHDESWNDFEPGMEKVLRCKRMMKSIYETCAHPQAPVDAQEFFKTLADQEQIQIEHIGRRLSALEQGY